MITVNGVSPVQQWTHPKSLLGFVYHLPPAVVAARLHARTHQPFLLLAQLFEDLNERHEDAN